MSERRYEASDLPASGIAKVLAGLFAGLLLSGFLVALMLALFAGGETEPSRPVAVLQPPPPRLEAHPMEDRLRLERAMRQRLESYGWTDRSAGLAHMPIEQAMRRVAAQGWGEAQPAPTTVEVARAHSEARR